MPITVSDLLAEINTDLPTNTSGLIRATALRQLLDDIVNNIGTGGGGTTTIVGGGIAGIYLTASATASIGGIYYCDTSTGSITLTLPASPTTGSMIGIRDALGTWNTANLVIAPGVNNIDSTSGLVSCDVADANFDLVWRGGSIGWATQFVVAPIIRRPAVVRTGAFTMAGVGDFLPGGQGVAHTGAFTMAGTGGFAPVAILPTVAANWNPSDKNADITLSLSNLKATRTGTSSPDSGVRGVPGHTSSHRYFELTVNALTLGSNNSGLGLATAAHTLSNYLGSESSNGIGVFANGYSQGPGWAGNVGSAFGVGDVIGIEMDTNFLGDIFRSYINGRVNTQQSGSIWGTGAWFPAMSLRSSDAVTANFGATPFVYGLPTGAQPWNTA
jgi:hypothetical protein